MADPASTLEDFLDLIAEALDLDCEIEVEERDGELRGVLIGEELGVFIGRHGQTIEAVQHLAYRAVNRGREDRMRVVVDAAGYRSRREGALQRQADEAAEDALRMGRPVALEPMNASERRFVHEYLRDRGGLETYSEGAEPERHLVVAPATA